MKKEIRVKEVLSSLEDSIGHFFSNIQLIKIENLCLNFICVPVSYGARNEIQRFFESFFCLVENSGDKKTILYPYKGIHYEINFLYLTENKFKEKKFFYAQPNVFNVIIDRLAKSNNIIISPEKGFSTPIKGIKGNDKFLQITENVDEGMKILGLEHSSQEIYNSPELFAEWIMSSDRFDSKRFSKTKSKLPIDSFTEKVIEILESSHKEGKIKPLFLNIEINSNDIDKILEYELKITIFKAYRYKLERILKDNEKKNKIISGKKLIEWGYKPGPIFKEILESVDKNYKNWVTKPNIQTVQNYVQLNFKKN